MDPSLVRVEGDQLVEQAIGRGAHDRVQVGSTEPERAGLLHPQGVDVKHAADAPAAYGVAFRLHFHPQPTGAVALTVIDKRLALGHLTGWIHHRHLPAHYQA